MKKSMTKTLLKLFRFREPYAPKRLTIYLDQELADKFSYYCWATQEKKTDIVRKALSEWLEKNWH